MIPYGALWTQNGFSGAPVARALVRVD